MARWPCTYIHVYQLSGGLFTYGIWVARNLYDLEVESQNYHGSVNDIFHQCIILCCRYLLKYIARVVGICDGVYNVLFFSFII